LCGARVTDQGVIQGQAHLLLRERKQLQAEAVQIWADVQVKHSAPLSPRSLDDEVLETIQRGHADALILSGSATARPASLSELSDIKRTACDTPVLVGSGVDPDNVRQWISLADGLIVGSSLKEHGDPTAPVCREAVRRFVDAWRCRTA
jgi:membrane complex biogenesis BtpA family protein